MKVQSCFHTVNVAEEPWATKMLYHVFTDQPHVFEPCLWRVYEDKIQILFYKYKSTKAALTRALLFQTHEGEQYHSIS